MTSYDILIRNGKVVSGDGGPWVYADVGVKDGKIAKVGYIKGGQADVVVDADGRFVAPGFIDIHNHSDLNIMAYPDAAGTLLQGVTTIVVGNCGESVTPVLRDTKHLLERYWSASYGSLPVEMTWSTFRGYLEHLEKAHPAVNVAPLVGQGALRIAVTGFDARNPTVGELNLMRELLREAMEDGAFGLSTGLIYPPGSFTTTDEIVELVKVVAGYGGIYATHVRGESYSLIEAVEEAIEIGEKAGVPVQVSHHKAAGKDNWGKVKETLKLMAEARGRGVEITCDAYPYTAAMTMLAATLPRWAQEGGVDALIERIKNPISRRKVTEYIETEVITWENFIKLAGWDGIVISFSEKCKECEGRSIAEISKTWGMDPYETLFNILLEDEAKSTMIMHLMREDDVMEVLKHPLTMIGSDSWVVPLEGKPHPRFFGTFPRVLGRYARDLAALRLEEAVMKMTSMPARKLGLGDRGLIAPGFRADMVIFDMKRIADKATFQKPTQLPEGIDYVLVNGMMAVEEGKITGVRAGMVLRKTP